MFRRFNVPKVLYFEDSIFRRFYVPKVLYSEGSMLQRFYIPKVLCSGNPLPTAFFYQLNIHEPGINDDCACEKLGDISTLVYYWCNWRRASNKLMKLRHGHYV